MPRIRSILNIAFMILALVGVILYFVMPTHGLAFVIIGVALVVKIVEFFLRFMF